MKEFYPIASGNMAIHWAKQTCPVCHCDLEHLTDEHERDDDIGDISLDSYQCDVCHIFVIYVYPIKYDAYKDVPPTERRYRIESF